jgi:hypothetical protein
VKGKGPTFARASVERRIKVQKTTCELISSIYKYSIKITAIIIMGQTRPPHLSLQQHKLGRPSPASKRAARHLESLAPSLGLGSGRFNAETLTSFCSAAGAMRAITGAVTSSQPCNLRKAARILSIFSESAASNLPSDCTTYVSAAADAASDHHNFLCGLVTDLGPHAYEGLVEGARERQVVVLDEVPAGGPHGSIEEVEVAVPADEKKGKKRTKEEVPHEDKAVAGVASHIPASPEIISEQRRKKKEKHSNKELLSVVKQEPDLVVEEGGGSERKKKKNKKEKHSDKEVASIVKQEPDVFVEEQLGREKKGKKKKENVVEVKGQIVSNGAVEQRFADGDKRRKRKLLSKVEGDPKGVKEEKMTSDGDLNSEMKKQKKRGRGDDGDSVQEQGEHKKEKKQRKESWV